MLALATHEPVRRVHAEDLHGMQLLTTALRTCLACNCSPQRALFPTPHSPQHFSILREVVLDRKAQEKQKEKIANGHVPGPTPLQFLHVWTLREYLQREYFEGVDWSLVPA